MNERRASSEDEFSELDKFGIKIKEQVSVNDISDSRTILESN